MRPRLHGSVCLSVPEPNLRTKGRMKLKIGRKKPLTHVTRDPHLEVERSNTCQGRVGKFQCRTICVFYSEVNSKKLLRLKKCNWLSGVSKHCWPDALPDAANHDQLLTWVQHECNPGSLGKVQLQPLSHGCSFFQMSKDKMQIYYELQKQHLLG